MLVLSRRPGESIRLGEDIEIRLLEVRGDTVRLGITAPRSVKVWRKELLEQVMQENLEASRIPFVPEIQTLFDKGKAGPSDS